jgi:hypothetical protein
MPTIGASLWSEIKPLFGDKVPPALAMKCPGLWSSMERGVTPSWPMGLEGMRVPPSDFTDLLGA